MQDVADRAQVSLSTVSYTLSGKRPVSAETRARIDTDLRTVLGRPDVAARIQALGSEMAPGTAVQFSGFLASERNKWADVISAAHITLN